MSIRHTLSPQISRRSSPPITRSVSRNGMRSQFQTSTPVTSLTRQSLQPEPIFDITERVFESADDTDNPYHDLNSTEFVYKEHFNMKEMTSIKKEIWYDWIEYRVRMFRRQFTPSLKTVREALVILVLLAMFSKYARDCYLDGTLFYPQDHSARGSEKNNHFAESFAAENKKIYQSIASLQSKMEDFEKKIGSRVYSIEKNYEQHTIDDKGWKESAIEDLMHLKSWKAEISELVENMKNEMNEGKVIPPVPTPERAPSPSSDLVMHPMHISFTRRPPVGVNVANSLIGASIDESCSSRPASAKEGIFYDVMSYFGSFQEGYVLLDRDVLSPGEAWCTYDKQPTLTVKLARFIRPSAVSYQHVRWNGIIPNHAPKLYDLVACLDPCCTKWDPIVSNCEYKASEDGIDVQEQFCHVPDANQQPAVNHVQFRFRENHGNMTKTCAYLVRVYGDPTDPPKQQPVNNETISQIE